MVDELESIPSLIRTAADLRAARAALGLSTEALARMVLVDDGSSVRRWEAGTHAIPGPVSVILEIAMDFLRQRHEIGQDLNMLTSGKMRTESGSGTRVLRDTSDENIETLSWAKKSLEDALRIITKQTELLTRQPLPDGSPIDLVHWFNLRRLTYQHKAGQKDEWSLPGETSAKRALAYFERDARFSHRLAICDDADPAAAFLLEEREVIRIPFGASHRLRAGDLIKTYAVKAA
jgi:transcriptional regulator with XRE-family HTH domain